jgi:8-amino-7-oxononanoate synthase
MEPYSNELKALKHSGRYRQRRVWDDSLIDMASNDYLGLAHHQELHQKACEMVSHYSNHAPKSSMLVNGYHPIHHAFENALCEANGFESGIVMGSGFNANIGLIECLVRKGDVLLMDEQYHASGIMATKMCEGEVIFFPHNDANALEKLIKDATQKRIVVAVEGIYSMGGDVLEREILNVCENYGVVILLDEAHSSGVIGKNLMGVLDYYDIAPTPLMIKMGTLGKAYGSFGAYVLCSKHIEEYLINRAKNVIYATAPSLYDTALAHQALMFIGENCTTLSQHIQSHQQIVREILDFEMMGLILPIEIGDNLKVMEIQQILKDDLGVSVGAIRQPTVKKQYCVIFRLSVEEETVIGVCERLKEFQVK